MSLGRCRLTETTETIWSVRTGDLTLITPLELLAQFVQVGKRQFPRIRSVTDGEVDDLVHEEVAAKKSTRFSTSSLWFAVLSDRNAYCIVNFPLSIEQAGSLLSVILLHNNFDCCFCSTRSFSVCHGVLFKSAWLGLIIESPLSVDTSTWNSPTRHLRSQPMADHPLP